MFIVNFLIKRENGRNSIYPSCQCPIANASQRPHSAQPHTDVEIMKFLVLPFVDEILSNLFAYVNILVITIQQVCSNKTLLVWSIWPNLSQTLHKAPYYGPGSQLWRANGRGLYLAQTTKFPTWCVEVVSVGTASWRKYVVCHRGGLPQGVNQWNKGNIIWIMVLMYNKIISDKKFQQLEIHEMCECAQSHLTTGTLTIGYFSVGHGRSCREVIVTQLTHKHTYMKIKISKTI